MKAPFSYESRTGPKGVIEFRVADAAHDRVATCWDEENAKEIVLRLNAQDLSTVMILRLHAAIASVLPYIETPHVRATLQRAVDETGGKS